MAEIIVNLREELKKERKRAEAEWKMREEIQKKLEAERKRAELYKKKLIELGINPQVSDQPVKDNE
ncbi:MAG: hypothetical protein ACTSU2_07715 [Promethearchaeota archaeon]